MKKNHRRSLENIGKKSGFTGAAASAISPPSSARLCALLSIESGMSQEEVTSPCRNAILRRIVDYFWMAGIGLLLVYLESLPGSIQSSSFTREG